MPDITAYSDKLRHFPSTDPPTPSVNHAERERIQSQVQAFLDGGGAITMLTDKDYTPHRINLKRKELVNYLKKKYYKRRWNNGRGEW